MKLAILSDIHSNVLALEAVLSDARRRKVEKIFNLGDILYGPIAPKATYDFLMAEDCLTISGNQDRLITMASDDDRKCNPTLDFILQELGAAPLTWLRSLPPTLQLSEEIFLCHGTPQNDFEYLLEDVRTGFPTLRHENAILMRLSGQTASLVLCGHTHLPRAVQLSSGQLLVNPGSVGLPAYADDQPVPHRMENYSPHATYAVVEKIKAGWQVAQIRVPYNYHSAARLAEIRQRPDWAYALRTGRALG